MAEITGGSTPGVEDRVGGKKDFPRQVFFRGWGKAVSTKITGSAGLEKGKVRKVPFKGK